MAEATPRRPPRSARLVPLQCSSNGSTSRLSSSNKGNTSSQGLAETSTAPREAGFTLGLMVAEEGGDRPALASTRTTVMRLPPPSLPATSP